MEFLDSGDRKLSKEEVIAFDYGYWSGMAAIGMAIREGWTLDEITANIEKLTGQLAEQYPEVADMYNETFEEG